MSLPLTTVGVVFSLIVTLYVLGFDDAYTHIQRNKRSTMWYASFVTDNNAFEGFICEPMAFHGVGGSILPNSAYNEQNVYYDDYSSTLVYIPIAITIALVFWATLKERKSFIVQLFWANLLWDYFICRIAGYGCGEPHLFAMHWIWGLPLILAVLIKSYESHKKTRNIIACLIIIASIIFFTHNIPIMLRM